MVNQDEYVWNLHKSILKQQYKLVHDSYPTPPSLLNARYVIKNIAAIALKLFKLDYVLNTFR